MAIKNHELKRIHYFTPPMACYLPKRDHTSLKVSHQYEKSRTYQVVVKVIDILRNDTTKLLTVEI